MTSPAAPDADTDRGTVGDILLARGYITEEQLTHAAGAQQQTGKPLGQVLVEAGAITRLELASALAEQWSDTATWLGPPAAPTARESKRKRAPVVAPPTPEAEDAGFTQQLQEAVVSLARRVAAFEPELADLRLRLESGESETAQNVLDRVEVLQDGLTVLSGRIDELTEGTESAFATIQEGSAGLAGEIEALGARVEAATETTALDELRGRIDALDARPAGNPELEKAVEHGTGRLDELTSRLDELAANIEQRVEQTELAELQAEMAELAARPQADPALADRLEELTGRIEALAGTDALDAVRSAVEEIADRPGADPELAGKIDALSGRLDELAASIEQRAESGVVAQLKERLDELAARPQADPALADRLEELTGRIEALAGMEGLDAVRSAVEEIAGRPGADPELARKIDALSTRLDELAAGVEARVEHAALAQVQESLDELSGRIASLAEAEALEELRTSIVEVSERPPVAPELLEQLSELAARIEALATDSDPGESVTIEDVRAELAELASRTTVDPELERRIDHVVSRLDALHGRIEEVASDQATVPVPDPELIGTVTSVAERVEELAAAVDALGDRAGADELAELRAQLEAVAAQLGTVDEIGERLVRVEEAAAAPAAEPVDTAALQYELESRITDAASRIAAETAAALERWESERGALEARLDALATALADAKAQSPARAAAPAAGPEPPATPKPKAKAKPVVEEASPNVESELERLRMAVERINMHLGERERAISELIRSRGNVKVEDLAARITELEQTKGSAPKAAAKGAAALASGDSADIHAELRSLAQRIEESEKIRDKVLTQLERMASSIDWRFRRLESGEDAA